MSYFGHTLDTCLDESDELQASDFFVLASDVRARELPPLLSFVSEAARLRPFATSLGLSVDLSPLAVPVALPLVSIVARSFDLLFLFDVLLVPAALPHAVLLLADIVLLVVLAVLLLVSGVLLDQHSVCRCQPSSLVLFALGCLLLACTLSRTCRQR